MTVKSETLRPVAGSTPGVAPSSTTRWYFSPAVGMSTGSVAMTADRIYYQPILLSGMPIDRIGIDVTTGAAGLCRLGVYSNNNGVPSTLIIDAGTVDTTNIATVEATITTLYLPTDWVWLCAVFNATPSVRSGAFGDPSILGTATIGTGVRAAFANFTFAALTAAAPVTSFGLVANAPMIGVRKTA